MSRRDHLQSDAYKHRELPRGAVPVVPQLHPINNHPHLSRGPHSTHQSTTILEDRVAIQHSEIQTLLLDNQRLAATHLALKQDLALSQQDLRQLSAVAADVKAENDDRVREVYEKSLKLESEVRSIDAMSTELDQVRADVQKLSAHRQELTAELNAINDDITKAKAEVQQVPAIKAEVETVHQEIQRGRAAIECEKKNRAINFEHSQIMERNLVALTREIEKLRAELANAEKRARASAAAAADANPSPGYAGNYGNTEVGYGGSLYPEVHHHGVQQVSTNTGAGMPNGPHDPQGPQQAHADGYGCGLKL